MNKEENENVETKQEMPEWFKAFCDQGSTRPGLSDNYWSILLWCVPYLVYLLVLFEIKHMFWWLHAYSLIMVVMYVKIISNHKINRAFSLNPFDFVKIELIAFFNVVVFFGLAFFFVSKVTAGLFNRENISLFDFIYYSFVTVATLGYGDIYPVGWYGKFLAIVELCFGLWFVITVIPVAIADQTEWLRGSAIKRKKVNDEIIKAVERGEIKIPKEENNT